MSLSNLSSAQLAQLVGLIKEKETLQAKLEDINTSLRTLETGGSAVSRLRRGRKPGRPVLLKVSRAGRPKKEAAGKTRRTKRLKQPLLQALQAAGASGITVKELASKLKVKPGNIFSWFYTTGKKIKGIAKVGEAKYAFTPAK